MPKKKQIFFSDRYIGILKTKLPFSEPEYWWETDQSKLKKKSWLLPTEVPIKKNKNEPLEDSSIEDPKMRKKIKKLKLKYTRTEVKKAIEEDKKSLKDVEKLEEHLEEDIDKAEKKIAN